MFRPRVLCGRLDQQKFELSYYQRYTRRFIRYYFIISVGFVVLIKNPDPNVNTYRVSVMKYLNRSECEYKINVRIGTSQR